MQIVTVIYDPFDVRIDIRNWLNARGLVGGIDYNIWKSHKLKDLANAVDISFYRDGVATEFMITFSDHIHGLI